MMPVELWLSKNLRSYRRAAGLTQAQVGELAGVAPETVARIERAVRFKRSSNMNPTLETIERLAIALGVMPSDLLAQTSKPSSRAEPIVLALVRASEGTKRRALAIVRALVREDRSG